MGIQYSSTTDPATWVAGEIKDLIAKGGKPVRYKIINSLGGGASSLVFLAEELTSSDEKFRDVALKVLKRDVSKVFIEGLSVEEMVLRDIDGSLIQHGIPNPYVVKFFASSPADAEIQFLAMELARGKDIAALVGASQNTLPQIRAMRDAIDNANYVVKDIFTKSGEQSNFGQSLQAILKHFDDIQEHSQEIQRLALGGSTRSGMTEAEILEVFVQASKVTQVLNEELKRSFRDFQLKNFYYDTTARQLKIIDWNVVTERGEVDVRHDVFMLAKSLFYLFSRVSLDKMVSRANFPSIAGEGWFVGASQALQLAVESALIDQQQSPYDNLFDWTKASPVTLVPVSEIKSFGNALEMLICYHKAEPGQLILAAEKFARDGKIRDADALLQMVEMKMSSGQISLPHSQETKIKDIRSNVQSGQYTLMDPISRIKSALNAMNRDEAISKAGEAISEQPDSLAAQRWNVVVRAVKDKPRLDFEALWKSEKIQTSMLALENHLWDRAMEGFTVALGENTPLHVDAGLNKSIENLSRLFSQIAIDRSENGIQEFIRSYEEVDKNAQAAGLSYHRQILADWGEWQVWRTRAEQLRTERKNLEQVRSKISSLRY